MTSKKTALQKGRAVLMAGLLVLSVVAMSAAFAGGAAASHADEDVTFNDQAIGANEDGEPVFVVQSVDAHAGQYLVIENENTGEVLYEDTIDEDLTSAAIFQTVEEPGEYTVTVYEDETRDDVEATDSASVYVADIVIDDQTSTDETIDQVTVDAGLFDSVGEDGFVGDTEFDVVLTDEDGNELGSATDLTDVNEGTTVDTSAIDTETVVTATLYVDGEPLPVYDADAEDFGTISDSATVTPGVDDGDDGDDGDNGDDGDDGDNGDDGDDGDDKNGDDGDDKDGDGEKDYTKKGEKDYTKKGEKDYDDKNGDDKDGDQDTDSETDQDSEQDSETDQDTDSETDQDADNDADVDQDQDDDQENKSGQDSLPGFGIGVSLVALLAAAMLALRQN